MIGGFFFLRFINPAIVTPQAYMLVEGVPAKHPRRTLTLVRASGYLDARNLDSWVHDPFVDCQDVAKPCEQAIVRKGGLHDHAQSVRREQQGADQPVLEQPMRSWRLLRHSRGAYTGRIWLAYTDCSAQMDQYMALSKKDLIINITLNELYNTHSLILQHVEVLVRARGIFPAITD